ncbi:MAG: GTP-binding protein [Cyanobacteriota bacterium]|nr:GTP-binding protein [Cyanobacteriota bacterium]
MNLRNRLWLLLALLLAALVVIGVVLQAINQLIWQLSAVLPYGLVGPVMALLGVVIALVLLQLIWPWLQPLLVARGLWPGSKSAHVSGRAGATAPSSRRDAARQNLEAIDQTLERVRDAMARQLLDAERQRMAEELERGDLELVVFGAGSTGKTSLIRALLDELVGAVGAAMGSTTTSQRYRLRLRGLKRAIWLIDTPGILEAGDAGQERERTARQLAAEADLLLLVVDGDLRAAEMQVFETLASLGKRLLLVLNKCDLRGEQEESRLLSLLRARSRGRIDPADVIAASAAPQSIPRPGGKPLQPQPEVEALLRRIATVLHQDGEELIADNLLLQCRRLSEASQGLLARQRRSDAESIVDRTMWIGAGVLAVTPLPGLDLLGTAAVNAQMVIEIGRVYGIQLSRDSAQELALSVGRTLATLGLVKGGVSLLSASLSLNLPALVISRAVQAVSAAWLTRVAGLSFITYFAQNQDWGDGGVQEVVQRQYDLSRRDAELRRFLERAISQVVEPLKRQQGKQLPPRPQER